MPGYGYGDTGRRRRRSDSRSSSQAPDKRQRVAKTSKTKKKKLHRDEMTQEDLTRTSSTGASGGRSGNKKSGGDREKEKEKDKDRERERERERGRDRERERDKEEEKDREKEKASKPAAVVVDLGKDPKDRKAMDKSTPEHSRKGSWRAEIEAVPGPDSDNDATGDGFVLGETDEEVARKLAESRARREALIAKWVTRGENQEGEGFVCPETNLDGGEGSESDGEVVEEKKKEEGDGDSENPETLAEKKALNRFILDLKAEHDGDMFQEDEDQDALRRGVNQSSAISQTGASADDWNDREGYYQAQIGEVMDGRYKVTENMCGKGVFSNVIKAKDEQEKNLVAIKIMRCNDMMRKAAEKEIEILEKLNKADKGNKKNVIRLLRTFMYRGHLCLVFECMWDNLRMALKKYTKDKGMSLQAVRAYTKQLLVGLRHIHRSGILHADIKPDNILITAGHNLVKICDLGSAMELTEIEPTPYLVSRFYRSPEICLAAKYGPPADVFAMGATIFELFTGKILFPGKTNNDMLRHFMDLKGKFPHKIIKSGMNWKNHFDENLDFKYVDKHPATRKRVVRTVTDCSAKRSMLDLILARVGPEKQKSDLKEDQLYIKKAKQFADLLSQMTVLDPEKRATPDDLLQHPFLNEGMPAAKGEKKSSKGA